MPHIIIEHSKDISKIEELFLEIPKILENHKEGNFSIPACNARSISFDKFMIGEKNQEKTSFIHISLKILAGRSVEIRKAVAKEIVEYAKNFVAKQNLKKEQINVTVDVIDMEKEPYQKITL